MLELEKVHQLCFVVSTNGKREKHYNNYLEKVEELRKAIEQNDLDSFDSILAELNEHFRAISCDIQKLCAFVTEGILPPGIQNIPDRIVEEGNKIANEKYSKWERGIVQEKTTKSETTSALSPKKVVPANSETVAVDSETASDQDAVAGRSAEKSKAGWLYNFRQRFAPPSSTPTDGEESAPEGDDSANDITDGESEINTAAAAEIASESVGVVSEISEDDSSAQAQTSEYGGDATAAPLSQLTSSKTSEDMPSSSTLESFDAILNNSSEDNLVAGIDLPILLLVQSLIDLSFRQEPNDLYEHLKSLTFGFISVLSDIPNLSKLFAFKEAVDMELIAKMGSSTGIGSIVAFCEVNDSVEDGSQPPEKVPDWLFEVKAAIYRAKNSHNDDDIKDIIYRSRHGDITGISRDAIDNEVTNDDVRSFIDSKVSNSCVKGHLAMDFETTNLLRHALDLYFVTSLLQKMTVADIFRFLSKASSLIEDLKEFARRSNPTVDFDEEEMAALDFLFTFVLPAFERDELLNDAWRIGCLIICHLNKITSVGNNASSDAKAKDPRKIKMRHEQRQVECESFDGVPDESAVVHWSGEGDTCYKRRSFAIRITAVFLFRKLIEKRLPSTYSFKFGFSRSFLRLSATSIGTDCVFIKPDIFSNCQDCMAKRIEKMMKALKNKDETGGERRTIFIRDGKQRKSLKLLLDTYDRLVSTSTSQEEEKKECSTNIEV